MPYTPQRTQLSNLPIDHGRMDVHVPPAWRCRSLSFLLPQRRNEWRRPLTCSSRFLLRHRSTNLLWASVLQDGTFVSDLFSSWSLCLPHTQTRPQTSLTGRTGKRFDGGVRARSEEPTILSGIQERARWICSAEGGGGKAFGGVTPRGVTMAVDIELLNKYVAVAEEAAVIAGKLIQTSFYEDKKVEHKGKVDLVTATDKACEKIIFAHLSKAFPTHKLLGEEASSLNGKIDILTDEPTWIVDPLDGTTNFVHSFPFVCVSIGLTIGKVPVVGVVYNPILDELYTGTKEGGAFLNGQRISASDQTDLGNALAATEVGTARDVQTVDASTNRLKALLFKVRSLRMSGSCAMNLCGVACGRLDMFYEIGFGGPWDVAAGVLIVQEAGGLVFDPSGKPFDIMSQRVCSSNGHLKDAAVEALRGLC